MTVFVFEIKICQDTIINQRKNFEWTNRLTGCSHHNNGTEPVITDD